MSELERVTAELEEMKKLLESMLEQVSATASVPAPDWRRVKVGSATTKLYQR